MFSPRAKCCAGWPVRTCRIQWIPRRVYFAAHLVGHGFDSRFNPARKRLPRTRLPRGKSRAHRKTNAPTHYGCPETAPSVVGDPLRYKPFDFAEIPSVSRDVARSEFSPVSRSGPPAVRVCGDSLPSGTTRRKRNSPRCGEGLLQRRRLGARKIGRKL